MVKNLELEPFEKTQKCLQIQQFLIKKIRYIESRIRYCKAAMRELKRYLRNPTNAINKKEDTSAIKDRISYFQNMTKDYQLILQIFREFGDALAFIYWNKWDIKPMSFNYDSGFISGKKGFSREYKILKKILESGKIAIMHDLTNCLRHGDITIFEKKNNIIEYNVYEIKSSKNENTRTRRQKERLDTILNYIETDSMITNELEGLKNAQIKREATSIPEKNNVKLLNTLISEAELYGYSHAKVEDGLYYLVTTEEQNSDANPIKNILSQIKMPPALIYLNAIKHRGIGYSPFALSFANSLSLYNFLCGKLIIMIIVDIEYIKESLKSEGLDLKFMGDNEWPLIITPHVKSKYKIAELRIGAHFWWRLFFEFLSLDWFVNDIIYRFKQKNNEDLSK